MLAWDKVKRMDLFGLTDPYIIGAYVACFACTALCFIWALWKRNEKGDEEDE